MSGIRKSGGSIEEPQRPDDRPADVAEDGHDSDQCARDRDLLRADEVGDIALERALGEVRAELQQDDEGHDRDERLRGREPQQEEHVEGRPDGDVGLASPPPAHRVVADGPDGRLDDDRHHDRDDLDQRERRARRSRDPRGGGRAPGGRRRQRRPRSR